MLLQWHPLHETLHLENISTNLYFTRFTAPAGLVKCAPSCRRKREYMIYFIILATINQNLATLVSLSFQLSYNWIDNIINA